MITKIQILIGIIGAVYAVYVDDWTVVMLFLNFTIAWLIIYSYEKPTR